MYRGLKVKEGRDSLYFTARGPCEVNTQSEEKDHYYSNCNSGSLQGGSQETTDSAFNATR